MDKQRAYELLAIPAVSPSLAETLRNCPLQAGISRIRAVRMHVLGNPKAWLGTAYHSVFEQVWASRAFDGDVRIDEIWTNAIALLRAQSSVMNAAVKKHLDRGRICVESVRRKLEAFL